MARGGLSNTGGPDGTARMRLHVAPASETLGFFQEPLCCRRPVPAWDPPPASPPSPPAPPPACCPHPALPLQPAKQTKKVDPSKREEEVRHLQAKYGVSGEQQAPRGGGGGGGQ